ncbi:reverse transcriptase domain-containing protein, partial [Tanacetum coccineum]
MPLSVWKKLSLPELTLTRMTLELANRSVAIPVGVAKDVFVKVGKFYFLADFVVVDYDVDPQIPLILGRPFLRTARALIDVHGEELTLRVNDEAITFKVGHTSRYSCNYYDETVHQVNVIDVACEEYAQEVLGFSDSLTSGNPIPLDPIIASSSPSFTPFEGGDFILEEIETFLRTPDELSNLDNDYYDTGTDLLKQGLRENIKTTQNLEIINLNKRVKKLEKKKKARTLQLKRRLFKVMIESSAKKSLGDQEDTSKQGRNGIDQDEEISWFQEDAKTQGSAPVTTAGVSVSTIEPSTPPTTTIL